MRGPGDFLGVRQSGLPEFRFANPFRDGQIMQWARESAEDLLSGGEELPGQISEKVEEFWSGGMEITESG